MTWTTHNRNTRLSSPNLHITATPPQPTERNIQLPAKSVGRTVSVSLSL